MGRRAPETELHPRRQCRHSRAWVHSTSRLADPAGMKRALDPASFSAPTEANQLDRTRMAMREAEWRTEADLRLRLQATALDQGPIDRIAGLATVRAAVPRRRLRERSSLALARVHPLDDIGDEQQQKQQSDRRSDQQPRPAHVFVLVASHVTVAVTITMRRTVARQLWPTDAVGPSRPRALALRTGRVPRTAGTPA